jgi:glycosyltransferase involved in cell wall biosynthesis
MQKKKILVLSDHALSTSGVGTQTRHLLTGLIAKGSWTFRQFGAAMKHTDYNTIVVNEDLIIKPIDGFGNRDLIRITLATEKPDAILIFTDPRFFIWLFEMIDEVHQVCPVAWWHVWDNEPNPSFNDVLYESTDLINCHSDHTYNQIKDRFAGKVNYIPHALPPKIFFPISQNERDHYKRSILGSDRMDHFVGIWNNRNAKRKRPNDVLVAWKMFLDELEKKHGHRKASMIMHTDPLDMEGPNLYSVAEMLGITKNVFFSKERLEFEKINILYNISDFCINISYAEGFGLGTLESMHTGTPIIALKTGGLTRQVVDHRDGSENGFSLPVEMRTMVGSQQVPYIYEDYVSCETVSTKIMQMYELSPEQKKDLRLKVQRYAETQFNYQKTVDDWDRTLSDLIERWNRDFKTWTIQTI